ncbi:MAG: restriction endonuclease, partial [Candidatus Cloacimonetes bacterium]|nr:restriction endonuclease [Candidatus Cloacimonadota bacterium]
VFSRDAFQKILTQNPNAKCIEFVSLQDLKGSLYFGGHINKLEEIRNTEWDILIIDEAHEGVDTYKTDIAFDQIKRKFTLHLSGTPFKALANDKFSSDAIFNWTYADEQQMKQKWDEKSGERNPYATLPKLNMFTYQMSEIVQDEVSQGMVFDGETVEYAFDLNEFFKVNNNGKFEHDDSVDKFLDALTTQKKFPFSTPELRDELKHTLWLLNRVESAKALANKLKDHPTFKDYKIVLAAGDGKLSDDDEIIKSLKKVKDAIRDYDKTITISVGQLTTGVTIKEWTAVLMLSNMKSPALYMQAAFRAQNTHIFTVTKNGKTTYERKENAYVFDFDPGRTLTIYEKFANDLSTDTAAGKGTDDLHKQNVRKLLNFFPVIGEDEGGELIELDAEKVLSIPRKIRSKEVVRRGFMSNFLFQNITNVFAAPQEVLDIIQAFTPFHEPKATPRISGEDTEKISLNENGEVALSDGYVIGLAHDKFGTKLFEPEEAEYTKDAIQETIEKLRGGEETKTAFTDFKNFMVDTVVKNIVDTTENVYGSELRPKVKKQIERKLQSDSNYLITKTVTDYDIKQKIIELNRKEELQNRNPSESTKEINKKYDEQQKDIADALQESLTIAISEYVKETQIDIVRTVETDKQVQEKEGIEKKIRDHLRGFSRSIPAFLMAYEDETVTLASFDSIIPDNVFKEVTSITLDQFRFLRDGGRFIDENTGEDKEFKGHLFDEVVFDDSVKEFLNLKRKLANYFDETTNEDIFDYIPPQKTNQIFTPKNIVVKMVDNLEIETPGCFDDPNKTFIDLYVKSGLYITEIVKRLYQSPKMKMLYPDKTKRLQHIFEKQVYGLAPTEIIYKIASSFILSFDEDFKIKHHNFRQIDPLPHIKNGTLQKLLGELFEK